MFSSRSRPREGAARQRPRWRHTSFHSGTGSCSRASTPKPDDHCPSSERVIVIHLGSRVKLRRASGGRQELRPTRIPTATSRRTSRSLLSHSSARRERGLARVRSARVMSVVGKVRSEQDNALRARHRVHGRLEGLASVTSREHYSRTTGAQPSRLLACRGPRRCRHDPLAPHSGPGRACASFRAVGGRASTCRTSRSYRGLRIRHERQARSVDGIDQREQNDRMNGGQASSRPGPFTRLRGIPESAAAGGDLPWGR